MRSFLRILPFMLCLPLSAAGQNPIGDLKLLDWRPTSQLVVKETQVLRPKFPVIDIHNHLGRLENTRKYLEEMDLAGVWKCVSLDGRSRGDQYKEHLKVSRSVSRDRFLVFFRPDFSRIDEPDFGVREAKKLEEAVRFGVKGLKSIKPWVCLSGIRAESWLRWMIPGSTRSGPNAGNWAFR